MTSRPASYDPNTTNSSSKLVRLVEDPSIKKGIEFDELSVDYTGTWSDEAGSADPTNIVGTNYPVIRINDCVFPEANIKSLEISSEGMIPTIRLVLVFNNTEFASKDMPKESDIVSIFVKTDTNALNYLRDDFIITGASITGLGDKKLRNTATITGKLYLPGMESGYNMYGYIGTAKDAIKNTAKKFKLGFAFNDYDDTDDFQNWICCGSAVDFLEDTTRHCWKNNTSFFKTWIDLYYNICFVNVNKFLLSDQNTEDEVDITFNSLVSEYQRMLTKSSEAKDATYSVKMFTNDGSMKGTPFYISTWKPFTNTGISFKYGYTDETHTFVHNQDLFVKDSSTYIQKLNNIPAYDQAKTNTHMIMRGRSKYDKNIHTDADQARANYDNAEMYKKINWTGIEYAINNDDKNKTSSTDGWSGNVHMNYNRAPGHNDINNIELNKMYVEVTCDGLCLQVMRGERIPVILYQYPATHPSTMQITGSKSDNINRMYSGFYIVDSIKYTYSTSTNNGVSRFSTKMVLKRREWPTPEKIEI